MRHIPAYLAPSSRPSRQSSPFYKTKRRDFIFPFLSGILILVGSFLIESYSDLGISDNVSKFQISFGFMALGYVLAWQISRRMMWLVLLVAAVARIAVFPIDSGDAHERMLWDGRVLAGGLNPYQLSPDAEEVAAYRGDAWSKLTEKNQVTQAMPAMLWVYQFAWGVGDPSEWFKGFLIAVDLILCLMFALRFGVERAALYAWNPLVIYYVAGLGTDVSLYLLPLVAGYLVWEFWIDQKGGVSAIKASGGIGSALGQMVCFSIFLIGLGVALNIVLLPVLVWALWHVVKRAGLRAGFVTLVCGMAPLTLSLMWASISLDLHLWQVLPQTFSPSDRGVSLLPAIVGFASPFVAAQGHWFLALLAVVSIWMIHRCESIERFVSLYLIWMLMLATSVFPWTFLVLAVVGVGGGNYSFRVASLSAFAYIGAYRILADTGEWSMPWTLQMLIWIPFLMAAIHFTLSSRSRGGFYVHSF